MRLVGVTQAPIRLGFLMALVFVGALDQTVIASALPALLSDLRVPFTHLDSASWLITAYLLGYVAVMPVAGRVADAVGRRPVILGALTIFAVGSLGASLCQSLLTLDLMRGVQAVGGGALLPVCLAMIGDAFPADRRGLPLGLVGAAAELGGVAGPPWGAAIIGHWSWRSSHWPYRPRAHGPFTGAHWTCGAHCCWPRPSLPLPVAPPLVVAVA